MGNKFNDYDSLLNSYNNLQRQFTKKCQELSLLKSGTSNSDVTPLTVTTPPLVDSMEQLLNKYPNARYFAEDIAQLVDSPNSTKNYLECYLDLVGGITPAEKLVSDNQLLQQYLTDNNSVVEAVLDNVIASTAVPITITGNSGSMSLALPNQPKTIAEASTLAKNYFNK